MRNYHIIQTIMFGEWFTEKQYQKKMECLKEEYRIPFEEIKTFLSFKYDLYRQCACPLPEETLCYLECDKCNFNKWFLSPVYKFPATKRREDYLNDMNYLKYKEVFI